MSKSGESAGILMVLFLLAIIIGSVWGWGSNVYKFTQCDFKAPYKAEIIRGIGIPVAFVGVISGYMNFSDGDTKE